LLADRLPQARKLLRHRFVQIDDVVESLGHLAWQTGPVDRHSYRAVALLQCGQRRQQHP
jgi:hypothetical protein